MESTCEPVGAARPAPPRSAALLLADAGPPSPGSRAIGVAVLGVLRELARCGPLLLAIDDIQWLDPSTARGLSFAFRGREGQPVRLLASYRIGARADGADQSDLGLPAERLVVGPASIGTLQRII